MGDLDSPRHRPKPEWQNYGRQDDATERSMPRWCHKIMVTKSCRPAPMGAPSTPDIICLLLRCFAAKLDCPQAELAAKRRKRCASEASLAAAAIAARTVCSDPRLLFSPFRPPALAQASGRKTTPPPSQRPRSRSGPCDDAVSLCHPHPFVPFRVFPAGKHTSCRKSKSTKSPRS
jgi:hypothetical protein